MSLDLQSGEKQNNYVFKNDILRNYSQKGLHVLRGDF